MKCVNLSLSFFFCREKKKERPRPTGLLALALNICGLMTSPTSLSAASRSNPCTSQDPSHVFKYREEISANKYSGTLA